jgi:hypothetical protein
MNESSGHAPPIPQHGFSPEQITALSGPLARAHVKQRKQGGSSVSYIEGWVAIAEANRIFGFDAWQRETVLLKCVSQSERLIGRDQKPGWGVTYSARVRITVLAGDRPPLIREGSGAGHGIDVDLGQAHESALKEAETDAMKRALMTFGNPFGLALYDKQQREVEGPSGSARSTEMPASQQAAGGLPAARQPTVAPPVRRSPPAGQTASASQSTASSAPAARPTQAQNAVNDAVITLRAAQLRCREAGLTDTGVIAMAQDLSKGSTTVIAGLSPDVQRKLATAGVSDASVAKWNAAGAALTDDDPDLPRNWDGPAAA